MVVKHFESIVGYVVSITKPPPPGANRQTGRDVTEGRVQRVQQLDFV